MPNLLAFTDSTPRVEIVLFLQDAIESSARQAAHDVGIEGVQRFFAGYKDSIDVLRLAA